MKRTDEPTELPDKHGEISREQLKELRRRIADLDNPVRYVIYSQLRPRGRWRLFLNVSDDTFCDDVDTATLFKREHVARAVATMYSRRRKRDLLIAKITTKNDRRRVLNYGQPARRAGGPVGVPDASGRQVFVRMATRCGRRLPARKLG